MAEIRIEGIQTNDVVDERKNEDEISNVSKFMLEHIYIRSNLPGLLAKVALAGHTEKALNALVAWGTGRSPIIELWKEISPLVKNLNEQGSEMK